MIIQADARAIPLSDESVQMCVTSPPYWGLRDYGTAKWEGGSLDCAHIVGGQVQDNKAPGAITTGQRPGVDASLCRKCGAHRVDRQLGLETTPWKYVENMVTVFREVRRVLRENGTLWLNLGDSYAGSWGNSGRRPELDKDAGGQRRKDCEYLPRGGWDNRRDRPASSHKLPGLKPKDLVGIPWRVAFALQADGWWLRQDIIWAKPNPMPESVRDRCTKAHEYIFLLSKSARYYYDAEAIKEVGAGREIFGNTGAKQSVNGDRNDAGRRDMNINPTGRNKRSVWTITTKPYPEAHFATFPPELPRLCILAGSRARDLVLDPFSGSGTTVQVAHELQRDGIGLDISGEYCRNLASKRQAQVELFV